MLEGWSVLAALARETSRVRLGTLVTGVTYRNPALLAKQVTTLDTISGGRAILGPRAPPGTTSSTRATASTFPPISERMDRLDEALTIAKAMFTEERPSFAGRYYRIDQALNVPRPVQPGGPPILVGGGGEQRTLRIAAKLRRHDPLVPDRPRRARAQDRGPRALLRGDRSRPVDDRADDRRAGDRRESDAEARLTARAAPGRAAARSPRSERRQQAAEGCGRTSTRGSPASRSTTTVYRTPEQIARLGDLLELVGGGVATPA